MAELERGGYPAYTTSAGWLGYTEQQLRDLCRQGVANGWTHFKVKARPLSFSFCFSLSLSFTVLLFYDSLLIHLSPYLSIYLSLSLCVCVQVGQDLQEDIKRLRIIREEIGYERKMMVDANQRWDVNQAIDYMKQLAQACFSYYGERELLSVCVIHALIVCTYVCVVV